LQLGAAAGANGIAARRVDAQSTEGEMADYEIFELGDVVLQSAATLRGATLAYKTLVRSTRPRTM
jgi:hypothetical protein